MDNNISMDVPVVKFWSLKSGRLLFILLLGLVYLSLCFISDGLSMAMVCMVNATAVKDDNLLKLQNNNNSSTTCPSANEIQLDYKGTFVWGTFEQGFMFSAMYFGAFLVSFPAAWTVNKFNPKHFVTFSLVSSAVVCSLFPVVAKYLDYIGLTVVRFFIGFFGFSFCDPAIGAIFARWYPPSERSTAIAIYSSGVQLAFVIGMPLNANLCRLELLGGWPLIFYLNAAFAGICSIIWLIFASTSAENNKFVSKNEKLYINLSLENENLGSAKDDLKREIPWLKIFASPVILTVIFCYTAQGMLYVTLGTFMPTYFKEALKLSLINNGLYSSLPYILQLIAKLGFSISADMIKQKTNICHNVICKAYTSIGFLGTIAFILACSFMDCTTAIWAVSFLSVANFMSAATVPGYQTASYSVAPAYLGVVMALIGFPWNICAILTPLLVSALTPQGTVSEWQHVFFLVAIFLFTAWLLFLIFGTVNIQNWAKLPSENANDSIQNVKILHCGDVEVVKTNSNVENYTDVLYFRSNSKIKNAHEKY